MSIDDDARQTTPGEASVDPRHLLIVGAGPGLGAAVARRFARDGYRLTLVARSDGNLTPVARELRAAGTELDILEADAGDSERLSGPLAPRFAVPGAPGVVIYSAARMAFDDLLTVSLSRSPRRTQST
jgi:short-subunit dehydrogenase